MIYKTLILEDNKVDASLMKQYLKKSSLKFEIKIVQNGKDYEKLIQSSEPDLIISDFRLHQYSGMDALNYRNNQCSNVPFVIISGHIGEENAADLIKKGATHFLMKNNAEANLALIAERSIQEFKEKEQFKQSEIAAKQNRMLLEIITNQAMLPVWIRDKEGKFYFVNQQFKKLFSLEDVEVIGRTNSELFDKETARQFDENDTKVKKSQSTLTIDEKVKTADGVKYYQSNLFLLKNMPELEGAVAGWAADITEQKRVELELKEAVEKNSLLLESIGEAFFSVNQNWEILYWNKAAEDLTGIERADALGKILWHVIPNLKEHKIYHELNTSLKEQKSRKLKDYYEPRELHLEISANPTRDAMSVFIRDVSEKIESERKLRETYERFEKVTKATNDAIWDWNLATNTIYWGGGYKSLFGYDVLKMSTTLESWTNHIHKEDVDSVMKSFYEAVDDPKQSKWQEEYRYLKKDGSSAYVMDRALIMRNEDGEAIRVIGAMIDITYQKEYEQKLRNLNETLKKYTKELQVSKTELEQFTYVTSHDLQEPLRMITSFMELLKVKYGDVLDEKALQYIHYAADGAKKMKQIIIDLLDFSRVGKNDDQLEAIDLNELIEFVLQLNQKLIREQEAVIEVDSLPTLKSYRAPLTQIFQNLIENSLKYSRKGVTPKILIQAEEKENEWIFSVKDNGKGIDPEYFDKIFIIFHRLESEDKYGGTGLGLSVVKKNIDNLEGRIWVGSEVNKGSTFYFSIPK
tara:strand:- start:15807 stop:18050 length:2244 start_codon:yes stop_codon:yes gene_type:complete